MHGEASILTDTNFWYGVSVVIFIALIFFSARKGIVGALDGEIERVKAELEEAARLRVEAQAILEDYRNRQNEAIKEAEVIVSDAKALAARLRKESEIELAETLKRHEQVAVDRIQTIQEQAYTEVRNAFLAEALTEARGALAKKTGSPEANRLIDTVIADLPKMTKSKIA